MIATQFSLDLYEPPQETQTQSNHNQAAINEDLASELFPTPDDVIATMLEPYIKRFRDRDEYLKCGNEILDPSAGRGHIFDYIERRFGGHHNFVAAEIEQDLRFILHEKDVSVIGSDWLEYDEPRMFSMILMNPPFSSGVKHVLHSWNHLAPEGNLVALINAETLRNPYTQNRKELKRLIQLYGSQEDLGKVFQASGRPTLVDVILVRLMKPKDSTRLEFSGFEYEAEQELEFEGFTTNPLAHRDIIKTLVGHYKSAREILLERHHSQTKLNWSLSGIEKLYGEAGKSLETPEKSINKQLKALKSRFWQTVFSRSKIGVQITSNFKRDFDEFQRNQADMAFTEANIVEVLEMFFLNRGEILQKCLVEVFDKLTKHHENCQIGAWKTNNSYKVNQKIIFPYGITYEKLWGFRLSHGRGRETYDDLDKILKYINGDRNICTICQAIDAHMSKIKDKGIEYREPFESSYFEIRIFKKGTVHLKFLDTKLWEEFNRRAAIGKEWIGPDY